MFPHLHAHYSTQQWLIQWSPLIGKQYLPPTTKSGQGYVFTGICDSVNRGGEGVPHTPLGADTPQKLTPPEQPPQSRHPQSTPLPEHTPPRAHTPGSRHPLEQTTPPEQTPPGAEPPRSRQPPPRSCEIRSTHGRYASYWNAILSAIISNNNDNHFC